MRKIPKAMAKLRKNVQKVRVRVCSCPGILAFVTRLIHVQVKEILSANDEYPVTVEALANDKDFKMGAVKRTDFELWAKDVLAEVLTPIKDALADANLTKVRPLLLLCPQWCDCASSPTG